MPNRLLLLSYAFPPQANAEAILSAKTMGGLTRRVIDVVCAASETNSERVDRSLDDYVAARFATVHRIPLPLILKFVLNRTRFGAMVRYPDAFKLLNRRTVRQIASRSTLNYCAMVSWSKHHSVHLAALKLKQLYPNTPWVAHFSDPWVDNPLDPYFALGRWINRRLERSVIEGADALTFTTDEIAALVMKKYPASWKKKVHVLPHPFDPALYEPLEVRRKGQLVLRHVGNFYGSRAPEPLFLALKKLQRQNSDQLHDIRIELVGNVPAKYLRSNAFRTLPDGLVILRRSVTYIESLRLMRTADLLLVIDAPHEQNVFLPSKLVDYVGSGTPIMALSRPGPSAELVSRLGGTVANVNDPHEIAERLAETIEGLRPGNRGGEATWGDQEVRAEFAVPAVTARFDALIDEVAGLERVQAP